MERLQDGAEEGRGLEFRVAVEEKKKKKIINS